MKKDQENVLLASLLQAMLGAISSNFRAVSFDVGDDMVHLIFLLEEDTPVDREEIDDIALRFEALQPGRINLRVSTIVGRMAFADVQLPGRVVYMRKES